MNAGWIDDEKDAELQAAWESLQAQVGDLGWWQYRGSQLVDGQWQHDFLNKSLRDQAESAEELDDACRRIPATAGWRPGETRDQGVLPVGMPLHLKTVLDRIPQQPQRQDATNAQLRDLRAFAIRLGLYDADNILRLLLDRKD